MKKNIFFIAVIIFSSLSCKEKEREKELDDNTKEGKVKYIYDNGSVKLDVVVNKKPERAVAFSSFMTEMLLSLGLEDRMVLGIAEEKIYKGFEEAFNKIPNRKTTGIHYSLNKEAFLLMEPDFVSGWDGSIRAETTGTASALIKKGIYPFAIKSTRSNATLQTLYEDFYLLGKIFGVEKRADSLVKSFKNRLKIAIKSFKNKDTNKRRTAVMMELLEGGGILVASSLASDLLDKANGVNIFKDLPNDFERVSMEALLERNPDVIFFYRTGFSPHKTIEEDVVYIKNHPALKNMDAIKNNEIHTIYLTDVAPGIRNIDLIIKMNKILYK